MTTEMKNYNKIKLPKGTCVKLSEVGYYDYWYPGSDESYDTVITSDTEAIHLSLWKNQGNYLAFKVLSKHVKTLCFVPDDKYVCVWIKEKELRDMI
jgi:hypothetical protein